MDEKPYQLINGDCIEVMAGMDEASVDAIVCDPPYNLSFMARDWDTHETPAEFQAWCLLWATEAYRILKPGGHILAFGGTRTYHRMACAIEDAGFEVRDSVLWLYGSGFPKSLDVGKAIDKAKGAEREDVYEDTPQQDSSTSFGVGLGVALVERRPVTDEAKQWDGWGTALKPAHEPCVLARKPLVGTVADNVLTHGTGGLNIDGCRVGTNGDRRSPAGDGVVHRTTGSGEATSGDTFDTSAGRWPANVILSHQPECVEVGTRTVQSSEGVIKRKSSADEDGNRGASYGSESRPAGTPMIGYGAEEVPVYECVEGCPVAEMDAQSGTRRSAGLYDYGATSEGLFGTSTWNGVRGCRGGASRFFYVAKAGRSEREKGLIDFEAQTITDEDGTEQSGVKDVHPTVKPVDLMRYLIRLVTPPDGVVLDPFTGSGSTIVAAIREGVRSIGIELTTTPDSPFFRIASARAEAAHKYLAEPQAMF